MESEGVKLLKAKMEAIKAAKIAAMWKAAEAPTPPFTPHHIQAAMANFEKPETASGPFTVEIIHALNKQVNHTFENEWGHSRPSQGTVSYFNQAFQNGGFESIDKWWSDESNEVGFFQMFWSKGQLWQELCDGGETRTIEHLKIWFEAYQQFIRENGNFTPPKPKAPRQTQKAKASRAVSTQARFRIYSWETRKSSES